MQQLNSLEGILRTIFSGVNTQIAGNCDVLEARELPTENNPDENQDGIRVSDPVKLTRQGIKAFKKQELELLIREPMRVTGYRLNGIYRVIGELKQEVEKLKSRHAAELAELSTRKTAE